ncbi:MAG: Bug family tripartite tricarboxylate transporter substrate binding protein [Candidatus Binatia bacterium]
MRRRISYLITLVIGLAFTIGASSTALGEELYKGKTIRFVVGFSPGGGYDTYTRVVARHISKYIPGNPTPIVQNMTGAGSLIAAHYIYSRAKPDGLTVGVWNSALILKQALGDRSIKFRADKFRWIGAPSVGLPGCAIMGFTGLRTLKDVLNSKKPIKMGGTRSGTTNDLPKILNKTLGTNFKVIPGYRGTATIRIAMQKREVDGACWSWESMRVTARSMLDAKGDDKLIPFITHGKSDDPEVKDLPRLTEVVEGEKNRAILKAWLPQYNFQRPLSLPPGTPKERLNILRKAFQAALKDPELLAEAKKSKLIMTYVSGEKVEKYVDQILAISPEAKESLQFLVIKKKKKKS